jgi:hypothetical protein
MGDDREHVKGEGAEVIDTASDALSVAAATAGAAVGMVVGNRAGGDSKARAIADKDTASEAVTTGAAGARFAAKRPVVTDRAAADGDG